MELGRVGVWDIGLRSDDPGARDRILDAARELEDLGYGAIWLGANPGVGHARTIIEATSRIVVATGILSIWEHEPEDVAREHLALAGDHPGRFVLGLGVSHAPLVGERYRRPHAAMVDYLDRLDAAGVPAADRVLAALGPKMLATARDRAAGAHPYFVTADYTRRARAALGEGPLLAPEVKVVLDSDTDRARQAAREHFAYYRELPNYTQNMLRLGFSEEDLADGGSDRLIDAFFAIGDVEAARRRVAEHFEAGADHVTLQVVGDLSGALPLEAWRALAPLTREF
ncbi:MAG TPA: LLM class F420-dependent oxidoreductase [Thermomonospora sp.]|nr:LLM class F420-dependent oxidoreductase [Thermomonospora sp.]